jgi:hypothetical protein
LVKLTPDVWRRILTGRTHPYAKGQKEKWAVQLANQIVKSEDGPIRNHNIAEAALIAVAYSILMDSPKPQSLYDEEKRK